MSRGAGLRRWEGVAREWVTVWPETLDAAGTVLVGYGDGQTRRVGTWILYGEEQ